MKSLRSSNGFTLMELLVSIVAGALVTLAATTVLLLGLRMNRHSMDTVKQQNTTRIVLSLLEDMASESSIKKVITGAGSWYVCSTAKPEEEAKTVGDSVLVAFDSQKREIYTGGSVKTQITYGDSGEIESQSYTYEGGTPILKGVNASFAELSKEQLLTFSIETEEGTYASSTYCRMAPVVETDAIVDNWEENPDESVKDETVDKEQSVQDTTEARTEFLKVATSQRGSPGLILEKIPVNDDRKFIYISTGEYYSHWYNPNWESDTPWCAIFVMWCLSNHPEDRDRWIKDAYVAEADREPALLNTPLDTRVALPHVDTLIEYLDTGVKIFDEKTGKELELSYAGATGVEGGKYWYPSEINYRTGKSNNDYAPLPGDLIFFDWVADGVQDCDHVGIVLTVTNNNVYTVEGNTADTVAVRSYPLTDPRIMGYGVLDWKTNDQFPTPEAAK